MKLTGRDTRRPPRSYRRRHLEESAITGDTRYVNTRMLEEFHSFASVEEGRVRTFEFDRCE